MMFRMSGTPWRSLYSFEEGSPYVLDAISEPERRLAPEIWIQTGTVYQKCSFEKEGKDTYQAFVVCSPPNPAQ